MREYGHLIRQAVTGRCGLSFRRMKKSISTVCHNNTVMVVASILLTRYGVLGVETPMLLPPIPSIVDTNIYTNEVNCAWTPSPDTNVTTYGLAIRTNASGAYLFTNWFGNVTNTTLTATNPLPWWIVAIAGDAAGDFSVPSNELPWNGLIAIDITNYVDFNWHISLTNPPANTFYRLQSSTDLVHWTAQPAYECFSNRVTLIWTNAPMPTNN